MMNYLEYMVASNGFREEEKESAAEDLCILLSNGQELERDDIRAILITYHLKDALSDVCDLLEAYAGVPITADIMKEKFARIFKYY